MIKYLLKRIGTAIVTLFIAATLTFFIMNLVPGDPFLSDKAPTEEARERAARYQKLKGYCEAVKKVPLLGKAVEGWEDKLRKKYGSRDYNALDAEMRQTFVKVVNQDLTDLYSRFQTSTLLIWGDEDTETPVWMAKEMEKRIPDAGLVILEGGTHFAYLEQIGRFNLIVRQFLKGDE